MKTKKPLPQVLFGKELPWSEYLKAERGRFELPLPLRADRFSKPARSAAPPPLQSRAGNVSFGGWDRQFDRCCADGRAGGEAVVVVRYCPALILSRRFVVRSAITVSLVPEASGGPFVYWDGLAD